MTKQWTAAERRTQKVWKVVCDPADNTFQTFCGPMARAQAMHRVASLEAAYMDPMCMAPRKTYLAIEATEEYWGCDVQYPTRVVEASGATPERAEGRAMEMWLDLFYDYGHCRDLEEIHTRTVLARTLRSGNVIVGVDYNRPGKNPVQVKILGVIQAPVKAGSKMTLETDHGTLLIEPWEKVRKLSARRTTRPRSLEEVCQSTAKRALTRETRTRGKKRYKGPSYEECVAYVGGVKRRPEVALVQFKQDLSNNRNWS